MAEEDFDSWESLLENGALDRKFQEIESRQNTVETRDTPECRTGHVILQEEDGARTPYAPPQPQLKILKRPSGANKSEILLNGEKANKQPIKTLQQREAEYAEARLRILGAAKSEEETVEDRLSRVTLAAGNEDQDCISNTSRVEFERITACVEVTRSPLGPDGSQGFHLRR